MDVQAEFNQAVAAARKKDFQTARTVLRDLLKEDPHHVNAWILFAHVAQTREHAIYCFERALFLDHDNNYVRQQLSKLRATGGTAPQQFEPDDRPKSVATESVYSKEPASQPVAHVSLLTSKPDTPKKGRMTTLEIILLVILGTAVLILIGLLGMNALPAEELSATPSSEPTPSGNAFFEAIYENVRAANAENVNRVMSTIHPDSPEYQQLEEQTLNTFATYDLYIEIYDLEIVKQTRSEVRVAYTMVKRKIRGPSFQDHRIQGIFILRPDEGIWKIYDQIVEKIENLN